MVERTGKRRDVEGRLYRENGIWLKERRNRNGKQERESRKGHGREGKRGRAGQRK